MENNSTSTVAKPKKSYLFPSCYASFHDSNCCDTNCPTGLTGTNMPAWHVFANDTNCPTGLTGTNMPAWNVFANFQGDGISSKGETGAQRPCCQELHVSTYPLDHILLVLVWL